ncbi:MAG TPA: enoyl-CoA hydratase/isomerase family protein [Solirubrobacteraceae bacterium]|nr:enoyl-CoA hydratase/isomerase family protein [Solirubrobacteraceae bacterium]
MTDVVEIEVRDAVCVVSLRRPAKLNAISEQMEQELCDAVATPEVRDAACVVFTGGADVFSAGADLAVARGYRPEEIVGSYRGTGDFAERVAALPQPTLSAIAGYCIGGGLELALATDFRIAEPSADFRFPEVALGILPSWGGAVRTVRLLGAAKAKELILLRERIDAERALALGLVTEVVREGQALKRALELGARLAELPRLAVGVTKRAIDLMPESSHAAGLELERLAYGMLAQTDEAGGRLSGWGR